MSGSESASWTTIPGFVVSLEILITAKDYGAAQVAALDLCSTVLETDAVVSVEAIVSEAPAEWFDVDG